MNCHVVGAQMNTVGFRGKRNVGARVDEKTGSRFPALGSGCSALTEDGEGVACQNFQRFRAQVFFAELDVVDVRTRGFRDFREQSATPGAFVAGKLASVGDVIKQAGARHQFLAYYPSLLSLVRRGYFCPRGLYLSAANDLRTRASHALKALRLAAEQLQILRFPAHRGIDAIASTGVIEENPLLDGAGIHLPVLTEMDRRLGEAVGLPTGVQSVHVGFVLHGAAEGVHDGSGDETKNGE